MISLLGTKSNYIVKVIKPFYGIPEVENHWFATCHIHNKKKLGMIESTYNPCLFFIPEPLEIVKMQTNNTLILADNNFASTKKEAIKSAKIMTKNRKYLTSAYPLKFNGTQIKLNSNSIVLTKESYIEKFLPVIDYATDFTSCKGITRKKLSSKEQYLAQRARSA